MTLSLVAVFIPVLLMGGILGRLLHEFAVTIIVAVLLSGFVSLTLTPLLCSRMLKVERKEDHGRIFAAERARVPGGARRATAASLRWALRHRRLDDARVRRDLRRHRRSCSRGCRRASCRATTSGQLFVITEAAQDISFDAMSNLQQQVAEIIQRNPHVENVMSFAGAGGPSSLAQQRPHLRHAQAARASGRRADADRAGAAAGR